MLITRAFAKLNLSLEILGRRPDGFHDMVSLMQTISLADTVAVAPATALEFECAIPELNSPTNLAYRAASLLRDHYGIEAGIHIRLEKSIPAAAGLGGGSSDAATALIAAAHFWRLPVTCKSLQPLAASLGSDVPFFLAGGTALVKGRGERVTPLPPVRETWYLLVKPAIAVSTRDVFAALRESDWDTGAVTRTLAQAVVQGTEVRLGINSLEKPLFRLYPEALACFRAVQSLFPDGTMISGSGPTVFAVCRSPEEACAGAEKLGVRYWTRVAHSIVPPPGDTPCR
jgi:4-diphosphocytidyl-2-C-methyl-D-erythritol kinase